MAMEAGPLQLTRLSSVSRVCRSDMKEEEDGGLAVGRQTPKAGQEQSLPY